VRILYFSRDYTPHDYRFLSVISQQETHEVFFLQLECRNRQMEDRPLPAGVQSVHWKGGRQPVRMRDGASLLLNLKRVLHQVKPDLVHAGPIQTCAFLTALAGFHPLVSMSWGSDLLLDADRNPWWQRATRFTLARTDTLVADCEAVRKKAESFGFKPGHTVVFPWGIDLEHFCPGEESEFRGRRGWEDAFVLLSLRSWEPVYGVDLLVSSFCKAARQNRRLCLILLGSGSQAPLLHQMVEQYDLRARVFFGGHVSQKDLPVFYRSADLYLSASHSDGSSVSLMEALGCGLPVLVSDIPGNREWITPGKQGWLFPDGDAEALCRAILRATEDVGALAGMRIEARKLAQERANWNRNSKKMFEGYARAVQK